MIIAYFYDWLSVTAKHVSGVRPTAKGQLNLAETQLGLDALDRAQLAPPVCGSESRGPAPASTSGGSSRSQILPSLRGQRVWNTHPDGRFEAFGNSPRKRMRWRVRDLESSGLAESSASV